MSLIKEKKNRFCLLIYLKCFIFATICDNSQVSFVLTSSNSISTLLTPFPYYNGLLSLYLALNYLLLFLCTYVTFIPLNGYFSWSNSLKYTTKLNM